MKKLTFLCVAVMVTAALIFKAENSFSQVYQLENPGFEDWDGGSNDEPTHWNSFPSAKVDISVGSSLVTGKKHDRSTDKRPGSDGSLSCKIYSTSISIPLLGTFVANGTLTTGRIRVGAASTTSAENYNYTDANDANFRQALNAKPDSIVFWARFFNSNEADEASAHAYIHDDFSFKDPITANNNYAEHLVGKAEENFTRQGSEWVRHSCPFDYTVGQSNDPQYVLLTFTTNKTAGGGAANDSLLIDDIEFIYNPIRHEFSETACGSFTWDGSTYNESGDYVKTYEGTPRDSIVTLHLTITEAPSREENATACDSYTWYEQEYTQSGDFYHTIDNVEGCDSLITLHLTINNSVTNEITQTAEDSFTWNNETYTVSGDYTQNLTTINDCDSIVTLHLTITTTGINESEIAGINVYPNPAKDRINIEGAEIKSVSICDIAGREIAEYKNNGENTMNISAEMLESGNYMLVIRKNDGSTATQRLVIVK